MTCAKEQSHSRCIHDSVGLEVEAHCLWKHHQWLSIFFSNFSFLFSLSLFFKWIWKAKNFHWREGGDWVSTLVRGKKEWVSCGSMACFFWCGCSSAEWLGSWFSKCRLELNTFRLGDWFEGLGETLVAALLLELLRMRFQDQRDHFFWSKKSSPSLGRKSSSISPFELSPFEFESSTILSFVLISCWLLCKDLPLSIFSGPGRVVL